MTFDIRQADESDIATLDDFYSTIGQKDQGYFESSF